jgi:hypothetical protein
MAATDFRHTGEQAEFMADNRLMVPVIYRHKGIGFFEGQREGT